MRARAWLTALAMTAVFSAVALVFWVGGRDVLAGELSGGELAQFVFFAVVVAGAFGAISEFYGDSSAPRAPPSACSTCWI